MGTYVLAGSLTFAVVAIFALITGARGLSIIEGLRDL